MFRGCTIGQNSLGIVQILQIVQSHASGEKQGSILNKVELMKVPTMTGGGAIHMSKKFLNNMLVHEKDFDKSLEQDVKM